jgi:hypothetical protein
VSWELELYILSHVCVTIDGVWIGNWIYWPLQIVTQVTIALSLIHTLCSSVQYVLSLLSVFTSRCLVTAPNDRRSLTLGSRTVPVPQLPASNSNSSQQLNAAVLKLTHSLTQPTRSTALH